MEIKIKTDNKELLDKIFDSLIDILASDEFTENGRLSIIELSGKIREEWTDRYAIRKIAEFRTETPQG